jgi:hypothetical protein
VGCVCHPEQLPWLKPALVLSASCITSCSTDQELPGCGASAGKDVIGLAQTGSGKTGAFALPILQQLLDKPQALFALVLSPTRELAIQIAEQFEALGAGIGVKCAVLVGGIDMMAQVGRPLVWHGIACACSVALYISSYTAAAGPAPRRAPCPFLRCPASLDLARPPRLLPLQPAQAISLAKRPHVVVGTPGRVVDHLSNTKGFSLKALRHLVLDEADRLLNMDFEQEIDQILKVIPKVSRGGAGGAGKGGTAAGGGTAGQIWAGPPWQAGWGETCQRPRHWATRQAGRRLLPPAPAHAPLPPRSGAPSCSAPP